MTPNLALTTVEREHASRHRRAREIMRKLEVKNEAELITLLRDASKSSDTRQRACRALGYLATSRAEDALAEVFEKERSTRLRQLAWKALLDVQWKKSYLDTYKKRKDQALRLMTELSVNSVEELIQVVTDKSLSIEQRRKACDALGGLGFVKSLPAILKLFREDNPELINAATYAVIAINSRTATRALIAVIEQSTNTLARDSAIYALRFVEDERSKNTLIKVVNDEGKTPVTRGLAVEALAATSTGSDAVNAIIRATRDASVFLRYTAVNALDIDDPRARQALKERLGDRGRLDRQGTVGQLARRRLLEHKKFSALRRKLDPGILK